MKQFLSVTTFILLPSLFTPILGQLTIGAHTNSKGVAIAHTVVNLGLPELDINGATKDCSGTTVAVATGLVSDYTFRKSYVKSFAKILTLDNAVNTATRYAALSVDADKSTFSFSPLVFALRGKPAPADPLKKTYGYGNIDFTGKVNSNSIATIKDNEGWNNEFMGRVNLTLITGGRFFNYCANPGLWNQLATERGSIIAAVDAKYLAITTSADNMIRAKNRKILDDNTELAEAMANEYAEAEDILTNEFWTFEWRFWGTFTGGLGGVHHTTIDKTSRKNSEQEFVNYNGRISLNLFGATKEQRLTGYLMGFAEKSVKNNFSGTDPLTWNQYEAGGTNGQLITDSKSLYVYDSTTYKEQSLPTYGAQGILMWNNEKLPIGIDLNLRQERTISLEENKKDYKTIRSLGVIFPFTNKEGERSINIEPFYQKSSFTTEGLKSKEFYGIKFTVPIYSASDK